MNAQDIIEYIRTSEKKTPVKVYVWEKTPVAFPGCPRGDSVFLNPHCRGL